MTGKEYVKIFGMMNGLSPKCFLVIAVVLLIPIVLALRFVD